MKSTVSNRSKESNESIRKWSSTYRNFKHTPKWGKLIQHHSIHCEIHENWGGKTHGKSLRSQKIFKHLWKNPWTPWISRPKTSGVTSEAGGRPGGGALRPGRLGCAAARGHPGSGGAAMRLWMVLTNHRNSGKLWDLLWDITVNYGEFLWGLLWDLPAIWWFRWILWDLLWIYYGIYGNFLVNYILLSTHLDTIVNYGIYIWIYYGKL